MILQRTVEAHKPGRLPGRLEDVVNALARLFPRGLTRERARQISWSEPILGALFRRADSYDQMFEAMRSLHTVLMEGGR